MYDLLDWVLWLQIAALLRGIMVTVPIMTALSGMDLLLTPSFWALMGLFDVTIYILMPVLHWLATWRARNNGNLGMKIKDEMELKRRETRVAIHGISTGPFCKLCKFAAPPDTFIDAAMTREDMCYGIPAKMLLAPLLSLPSVALSILWVLSFEGVDFVLEVIGAFWWGWGICSGTIFTGFVLGGWTVKREDRIKGVELEHKTGELHNRIKEVVEDVVWDQKRERMMMEIWKDSENVKTGLRLFWEWMKERDYEKKGIEAKTNEKIRGGPVGQSFWKRVIEMCQISNEEDWEEDERDEKYTKHRRENSVLGFRSLIQSRKVLLKQNADIILWRSSDTNTNEKRRAVLEAQCRDLSDAISWFWEAGLAEFIGDDEKWGSVKAEIIEMEMYSVGRFGYSEEMEQLAMHYDVHKIFKK